MEAGQIVGVPFGQVVGVIVSLVGAIIALAGAIVYIYKRSEAKNKVIVELTKSFYESTKEHSKALENNTQVIKELPETIMLHIKASR